MSDLALFGALSVDRSEGPAHAALRSAQGIALLAVLACPLAAWAQTERTVVYTGLLESDGSPVNATIDLNFALFACADPDDGAGCPRPLWVADGALASWDLSTATPWTGEWPSGAGVPIAVSSGRFSVRLGDSSAGQTPFPEDLLRDRDVLYLGIEVDGSPLGALQRIETVPFAVHALDTSDVAVETFRVSTLGLEVVGEAGSLLSLAEDGHLSVTGGVQVGDSDTCEVGDDGTLRWRDGEVEVCEDGAFVRVNPPDGTLFTRWGRSDCPAETGAELVYSGIATAGHYSHTGGTTSVTCLANEPSWDGLSFSDTNSNSGLVYSIEYDNPYLTPGLLNHDATCAVCFQPEAATTLIMPGRTSCPESWNEEYQGYLMGSHHGHTTGNELVCVDAAPEEVGTDTNHNSALWYYAEAGCVAGQLLCDRSYVNYREITCAVCTR